MTKRVTGVGGIFIRSDEPKVLQGWYEKHLGLQPDNNGYINFIWREDEAPEKRGYTVWSAFKKDTGYFGDVTQQVMINYRVDDLAALLEQLRAEGVEVIGKGEDSAYGKFAWAVDPEGNRVELWEPPAVYPPPEDAE